MLLRKLRDVTKFPLFVTVGSPLGIKIVKDRISGPFNKPEAIDDWTNGSDPEDFVALHSALSESTFGPAKIRNIVDVENGPIDAHSIVGYLSNRQIAREILDALS